MLPTLSAAQLSVVLGQDDEAVLARATLVEAAAAGLVRMNADVPGRWRHRRSADPARPVRRPAPLDAVVAAVEALAAGRSLTEQVRSSLPPAAPAEQADWVGELRGRVAAARRAADATVDADDGGPFAGHRAVAAVLGTLGPGASIVFLDAGLLATLRCLARADGAATPPPAPRARPASGRTRTSSPAQAGDRRLTLLLDALERLTPQVVDLTDRAVPPSVVRDV